MILVTGGAGFIGSNLVAELNRRGLFDILVVDNLTDGRKALNLAKCCIADYEDKDRFFSEIENFMSPKTSYHGKLDHISQVFHLGACSRTTEWDGKYMMDTNFRASRLLLEFCEKIQIPLVYASSASVYGSGSGSDVNIADNENPLNVYGYSKLLFDILSILKYYFKEVYLFKSSSGLVIQSYKSIVCNGFKGITSEELENLSHWWVRVSTRPTARA